MKSIRVKSIIAVCLALSISVVALPSAAQGFSGTGDGLSEETAFQIETCAHLSEIEEDNDAYYELTTSLDCTASGNNVTIEDTNDAFEGYFDGGNFTVTFAIDRGGFDYGGFFPRMSGATVFDLTLNGSAVGYWNTGGLTGIADDSTIDNVTSNATVVGGKYVGGLVSQLGSTSTIHNSSATGSVTSDSDHVGGLVGQNEGEILDSFATGDVSGTLAYVGGLIGRNDSDFEVSRSYATGDVESTDGDGVGGFVGFNNGDISESFATGNVDGEEEVGGFVGENGDRITNSYARGNVTGVDTVGGFDGYRDCGDEFTSYSTGLVNITDGNAAGGFIGYDDCGSDSSLFWDTETSGLSSSDIGTGKTTAEMQDIATFTDLATVGLDTVWDFSGTQNDDAATDDIWAIDGVTNDGYPFFGWEQPEPEPEPEPEDTQETTTLTPTGDPVMIEWDSGCDLSAFSVKSESVNAAQDIAFDYPNGMAHFTLESCDDTSVTVSLYYINIVNNTFVLRKFLPAANSYTTVADATLVATTVSGAAAIKATFTIVDNGSLDTNPAEGIISDPAGIALQSVGAPRTGGGGTAK